MSEDLSGVMTEEEQDRFRRTVFRELLRAEISARYHSKKADWFAKVEWIFTFILVASQIGAVTAVLKAKPLPTLIMGVVVALGAVVAGVSGWSEKRARHRVASILADDHRRALEHLRESTLYAVPSRSKHRDLAELRHRFTYVEHMVGALEGDKRLLDKIKGRVIRDLDPADLDSQQPEEIKDLIPGHVSE